MVVLPGTSALAYHSGGGGSSSGSSFHGGSGGGSVSHGSWSGGSVSHGSAGAASVPHAGWSGGPILHGGAGVVGGPHGAWGGSSVSHGGWNGGAGAHEGWGGNRGPSRRWGYGWCPSVGWGYGWWYGDMFYGPVADVPLPAATAVATVPEACQQFNVDGLPASTSGAITYVPTDTASMPSSPPPPAPMAPEQPPVAGNTLTNAPVPPAIASIQAEDNFTFSIPNIRGGYTVINLRKYGNGYLGPQGEYYSEFPKIELLKAMYGN